MNLFLRRFDNLWLPLRTVGIVKPQVVDKTKEQIHSGLVLTNSLSMNLPSQSGINREPMYMAWQSHMSGEVHMQQENFWGCIAVSPEDCSHPVAMKTSGLYFSRGI